MGCTSSTPATTESSSADPTSAASAKPQTAAAATTKKTDVLVIGGTGMIGSRIVKEIESKGSESVFGKVIIGNRSGKVEGKTAVAVDVYDLESMKKAIEKVDVIVCAHGPTRIFKDGEMTGADPDKRLVTSYETIMKALEGTKKKVLFVGGAGSLQMEDGSLVTEQSWFPKNVMEEANQHTESLKMLRASETKVAWTYLSPPGMISPGERTGKIALGKDHVLPGNAISAEDYSIAVVDEIMNGFPHAGERFTVAAVPASE